MSPWDILAWVVALAASLIVLSVAIVVVIASAKAVKRSGNRRHTIDD